MFQQQQQTGPLDRSSSAMPGQRTSENAGADSQLKRLEAELQNQQNAINMAVQVCVRGGGGWGWVNTCVL